MADMVIWALLGYLCGSLPFSYWIGLRVLRTDIRRYGDGNPGATNVFRAGGRAWGVVALLLDYAKGVIPVAAARELGDLSGWALVPVAWSPIIGHGFSAFLRFRGGKSVAVTFGVWSALTMYRAPVVLGVCLTIAYAIVSVDAWAVILATIGLLAWALVAGWEAPLLAVWSGNALLLAWKHRRDLGRPVGLRPWVRRRVQSWRR